MAKYSLLDSLLFEMWKYDVGEEDVTHVQTFNGMYVGSFDEFRKALIEIDSPEDKRAISVSLCAVMAWDVFFTYSPADSRWDMSYVVEPASDHAKTLAYFLEVKEL
ncbi:hypothetical protein ACEN19_11120 [Corynebacterium auriscanis]|uniref:hypothetical protein n=1 Tax=Corynebacterium auriscanis TaxID=99807 RepID=UPI003CF4960B